MFVNGVGINETGKETSSWFSAKRLHLVPKSLLRSGKNIIAVRLLDQFGDGSLTE